MINNTIIRSLTLSLILTTAVSSNLFASIQFRTMKTACFNDRFSSAVNEVINIKSQEKEDSFFKPKEPCCSKVGAVKTYAIVKVIHKKPSNNFNIKGTISGEGNDNSITRFLNKPIRGILTSTFGYRIHPKRKTKHFHSGIDLAAKSGTAIGCAGAGKVVFAGWKNGYGYVVMVDHGKGYETLYAHCSKLAVSVGQTVTKGQNIGFMGSSGSSTGTHLHFEIRDENGTRLNPCQVAFKC